jgi:hypothetical protein
MSGAELLTLLGIATRVGNMLGDSGIFTPEEWKDAEAKIARWQKVGAERLGLEDQEDLAVASEKWTALLMGYARNSRQKLERVRAENPATQKPYRAPATKSPASNGPGTVTSWALLVVGCLALSGCWAKPVGVVVELPETPTAYRTYLVEWPGDASRNLADYHTSEVDGSIWTTVPAVEAAGDGDLDTGE